MDEGYETCRNIGCKNLATTFAHLVAAVHGGRYAKDNLTLLCPACNKTQGTRAWRWLRPLTDEVDFLEVAYGGPSGPGYSWELRGNRGAHSPPLCDTLQHRDTC